MLKGLHIIAYLNTLNYMEIRTVNFQEEKRKKKGWGQVQTKFWPKLAELNLYV